MKYAHNAIIFIVCSAAAWLLFVSWPNVEQHLPAQLAAQSPPATRWSQTGAASPLVQGAAMAERSSVAIERSSTQPPDLGSTSLSGTHPDGDWGVNAQGQLKANRALRQRFDYFLSLIGEMPLAEIEAAFYAAAQKDLKEPALGQVHSLWQRYVQLQQQNWKHVVDLRQSSSWSAALSERQIVRRQMLGADVAYAFYGEDEAQLRQMITQVQANQAVPTEGSTLAVHPQASEREATVEAQWQQWEQRLQAARSQIKAYDQAPELSAPQRQQAIENYLTIQFQGTELIRARALLGV